MKEDNDLYDFVIQKGEIVFGEKNTADLRALRQKLYPIYKGVSTLP